LIGTIAKEKINKIEYNGLEFTPSPYQEKIFENIVHGTSNMVINAVAGSGKSTTIVNALKLIPEDMKVLFIAFNKDIVESLKQKVGEKNNVHITTYHSLGYSILIEKLKNKPVLDEYKYRTYIRTISDNFLVNEPDFMSYSERIMYNRNVEKLVDYGRFNLCQSVKEMEKIAEKYNINIIRNECEVAVDVLKWGKDNLDVIDYTDMVWIPYELDLKTMKHKYNWIFVDEAQDSSPVQQELFKKCFKRGARFCAVGDSSQCINAWAGADVEAFNKFLKMPNTKQYELPISYRCPVKVIEEAKKFVPNIQYKEGAVDGEIKYDVDPYSPKAGDMVLCRNTYPLIRLYMDFLRINKKAYIRGKDIGDSLIETINLYKGVDLMLNKSLMNYGLFRNLYEELFKRVERLAQQTNMSEEEVYLSAPIMDFYDTIASLEALSDNLVYTDDLISKIRAIFNDGGDGVCLSTIHKAKGLEADNVFILAKSLMPSIYAHQEWEIVSEENLEYVAITRAKKTLQYIDEDKFKIERNQKYLKGVLEKLEIVKNLLGTKPIKRKTNINIVSKPTLSGGSKNYVNNSNGKKAVGALKFGKFLKK
jgi:superfamily I DNA/RNA helicase